MGAPVTRLLIDLVDSSTLLQRVGDEQTQRILRAHRQLLREALAGHGGQDAKWLGDGLLATFASVAEAVRCAASIAQRACLNAAVRWPRYRVQFGSTGGGSRAKHG